jgi:hypothetical protein
MNDDSTTAMAVCLGEAAVDAVQALRQSTALIELLIAKGVLTQAEVDEQMRSTEALANNLLTLAARMKGEPAPPEGAP